MNNDLRIMKGSARGAEQRELACLTGVDGGAILTRSFCEHLMRRGSDRALKFVFFALLLIYLFAPISKAKAQTVSLSVYPPIIQVDTIPPADIKTPLTIENLSDDDVVLTVLFKPFRPDDSGNGDIEYLSDKESFGANPKIFDEIHILSGGIPTNQVTLSGKQTRKLDLEINIPKGEKASDYYFSILFISNNSQASDATYSNQIAGISSNVLLSIGPSGDTRGKIEKFNAPFFLQKGPVDFTVKIKNDSTHFISPTGVITISNMFGQTIGKVDLLPVNVLAGTARVIPSQSGFSLNPKAVWPEKFILGFYKANLIISLSQNGPILRRSVTFFAFPFEYLLGIIIAAGIVVTILLRAKRGVESGQISS